MGLALVLVAVAILCAPIALDQSLWLKDIFRFTYLQKLYLRERLLAGELPLWWAEDGIGRPFFALVQPGVLYPGNLILLALPMPLAYDVFSAAHLFIAAIETYVWLRRSDCPRESAALGAVVFALSGYLVSLFGNNGVYVFGAAWVPVVLAVAAHERARLAHVALALVLCLSAGDPQAAYFAGIALVAQALGRPRGQRIRAIGLVLGASVLAALVAAIQLVPGASTALVGRHGGVTLEDAHHFALHPTRLLELVWPSPFGRPNSVDWFVSPLVDEGTGDGYVPLTASIYCGLAIPWLALAATWRRSARDHAMAVLGVVTLVIAFGEHTPLWRLVFRFVPLANTFRYPEKYLMLTTLALAFLAARGHAALSEAPNRGRALSRALVVACAVAAIVASIGGATIARALVGTLSVTPEIAGRAIRDEALRTLVAAVVLLVLLELWARGKRLGGVFAIVCGLELLLASVRLVSWTPSATYRERSPILDEPAIVAARSPAPLRIYRAADQMLDGRDPSPAVERAALLPNCGAEDGVSHTDGYEVFHTPAEAELWGALRSQPLRLLQWTSTPFALLRDWQLAPDTPGLSIEARYPQLGLTLVRVEGAAPRVYLAQHAVVADAASAAHMLASLTPGHDGTIEHGEPRDAQGQCALDTFEPERIELTCEASAPSYAIVSEVMFPGWVAEVDGARQPILPANVAMRGVSVPAGRSRVVLRYEVPGLGLGAWLSLLGLVATAYLLRRR